MTNPAMVKDFEDIKNNIRNIKNRIMVLSGKGGVGKSTIAFMLASYFTRKGKKVGLLDVDIHGPSIPRLVGIEGVKLEVEDKHLLPLEPYENLKVVSIGYLLDSNRDAVIWRGPLKYQMIKSFLKDVKWGELDYLIVDLPPGTGDESLSICQMIGEGAGAVMATTPQDLSINDVRRALTFCVKLNTKVIGIVENMSSFVCPKCGEKSYIFKQGGGKRLATEMKVPFLGEIPIDPDIVRAADEGRLYFKEFPNSEAAKVFDRIREFFEK